MKRRARFGILVWRRRSHDRDDSSDFSSWVCFFVGVVFLLELSKVTVVQIHKETNWISTRREFALQPRQLWWSPYFQHGKSSVSAFPACILQTIESLFPLEVPHSPAQQEMILAEYRPQLQKRAISAGIQQSCFYPPAGGRHPPDLDNGLMLNMTSDLYWDQKGRIKLLIKQASLFLNWI